MTRGLAGLPGRLLARGDAAVAERFAAQLAQAADRGVDSCVRVEDGPRLLFCKAGRLDGRARLRHAARGVFLRQDAPRLREFDNLGWLRAHGFGAPRALAAGVLLRAGMPWFQFLFTEEVPDTRLLEDELDARPEQRAAVVQRLGHDVGRMHASGFVHRDLFPRNLLVSDGPKLHFLDAWRGGPRRGLRGPAYDLGCFMLRGAEILGDDEMRLLFEAYGAGRAAAGRPVRLDAIVKAAGRHQRRLAARRPTTIK